MSIALELQDDYFFINADENRESKGRIRMHVPLECATKVLGDIEGSYTRDDTDNLQVLILRQAVLCQS